MSGENSAYKTGIKTILLREIITVITGKRRKMQKGKKRGKNEKTGKRRKNRLKEEKIDEKTGEDGAIMGEKGISGGKQGGKREKIRIKLTAMLF